GIVAAILALRADAGQTELEHLRRTVRREMAPQVQKLAIEVARDAPRERLLLEIEHRGELADAVERRAEILRVDPDAVDRRADGERLTVAVGDHAAVGGDLYGTDVTVVALRREEF